MPVKLLTNKGLRARRGVQFARTTASALPSGVRVLLDYRPALVAPTGAGEWIHQMAVALIGTEDSRRDRLDVTLFSSSWKDRPSAERTALLAGATWIDRRVPVRVLNFAWHRLGWPPIERLARATFDVVQSPHPLLLPSRSAAQAVTIHDLDFLRHPEEARAEIRRDYPALVHKHAALADLIIVPSRYTCEQVSTMLRVDSERIYVCRPGAPEWARPLSDDRPGRRSGYILFLGALGPRKNIARLLDAYAMILGRRSDVPKLVLAGKQTLPGAPWLARIDRPPLAGHVELPGYVSNAERQKLYEGARLLVIPSLEEGFGLPALEAMALGLPVVASNRGSLPEVLDGAGRLMDPEDVGDIARAIEDVLFEPNVADGMVRRGLERARMFSWERSAKELVEQYAAAIARRKERLGRRVLER